MYIECIGTEFGTLQIRRHTRSVEISDVEIWDRNPMKSEVIGRCGGDEKTNGHAEPTKVEC